MGEKVVNWGGEGKKYDQAPSEPTRSGSGRLGGRGDRTEGTGIEQTTPATSAQLAEKGLESWAKRCWVDIPELNP